MIRVPFFALSFAIFVFASCTGEGHEDLAHAHIEHHDGQGDPTVTETVRKSPAAIEPLAREPLQCCADSQTEHALGSYLDLGDMLSMKKGRETWETSRIQLETQLIGIRRKHDDATFTEAIKAAEALADCKIEDCRRLYGTISATFITLIAGSTRGELDIAIAYSRDTDRYWIQTQLDLRTPYGDPFKSLSWGTREAVSEWDAGRQPKEREAGLTKHRVEYPAAPPPPPPPPPAFSGTTAPADP